MNKRQATRLASWVNGVYLAGVDSTGFTDGQNAALGDEAQRMIADAATRIGRELVARSGIPLEATFEEAVAIATGTGPAPGGI